MTWNGLACLHVKIRKPSNGCGFLSSGHKIFHHFMQNGHGSCRNISAACSCPSGSLLYTLHINDYLLAHLSDPSSDAVLHFLVHRGFGWWSDFLPSMDDCESTTTYGGDTDNAKLMDNYLIISTASDLVSLPFLFLTLFWRSEPKRASFRWWISVHCDLFRLKIGSRRSNVHL